MRTISYQIYVIILAYQYLIVSSSNTSFLKKKTVGYPSQKFEEKFLWALKVETRFSPLTLEKNVEYLTSIWQICINNFFPLHFQTWVLKELLFSIKFPIEWYIICPYLEEKNFDVGSPHLISSSQARKSCVNNHIFFLTY